MKNQGISRPESYLALLRASKIEWNELIESVVVPETWFFRDIGPFNTLVEVVMKEWLPANHSSTLRLLSLPCSSGEEPYSMAMALVDAGFSHERLRIDAVDISARALARAKRAIYGKHSFRGGEFEFRDKYFRLTAEGYALDPAIAKLVRFQQGNLLAPDFPRPSDLYDFIFCRNLLVYFAPETREKALDIMGGLLTPQALLFVGAAEQQFVLEHGFESARWPMAFACRKKRSSAYRQSFSKISETLEYKHLAGRACSLLEDPAIPSYGSQAEGIENRNRLQFAKRLADEGRLKEAASICEAHLQDPGPCAEAYYLLGLVRDAHGDPAAPDFYRKALYLEPNHYDSLVQLALSSKQNGDTELARRLMTRAKRVKSSSKSS